MRSKKSRRAADDDVALLVDRDHVVAVVEEDLLDRRAHLRSISATLPSLAMSSSVEWTTRQGARTAPRRLADVARELHELGQRRPRVAGQSGGAAVAGEHAADDPVADALVLDAVGERLHEDALAADAEPAHERQQERQPRDRRDRPAVVAKGRAVEADAVDLVRPLDRELEREQRTHREAGDEEVIDLRAQLASRRPRRCGTSRASRWRRDRRCCRSGRRAGPRAP